MLGPTNAFALNTCDEALQTSDRYRRIRDNQFALGEQLGKRGGEVTAFAVVVDGIPMVYRRLRSLVRIDSNYLMSKVSPGEKAALFTMTVAEAAKAVDEFHDEARGVGSIPFVAFVARDIGTLILHAAEQHLFTGLQYRGHPIVPRHYGLVLNAEGLVAGELVERIEGQTLKHLADQRSLSTGQWLEVFRQIRLQLELLWSRGLIHGDLGAAENYLIKIDPMTQAIDARLIDFNAQAGAPNTRIKDDRRSLDIVEDRIRTQLHLPKR